MPLLYTLYAMELPYFTGMATGASLIIHVVRKMRSFLPKVSSNIVFLLHLSVLSWMQCLLPWALQGVRSLIGQSPHLLTVAAGGGALFFFLCGLKNLLTTQTC